MGLQVILRIVSLDFPRCAQHLFGVSLVLCVKLKGLVINRRRHGHLVRVQSATKLLKAFELIFVGLGLEVLHHLRVLGLSEIVFIFSVVYYSFLDWRSLQLSSLLAEHLLCLWVIALITLSAYRLHWILPVPSVERDSRVLEPWLDRAEYLLQLLPCFTLKDLILVIEHWLLEFDHVLYVFPLFLFTATV